LQGFFFLHLIVYRERFFQEYVPRCIHDFDSCNSIIFPHIEDDVVRDSPVNDILLSVIKPDLKEISLITPIAKALLDAHKRGVKVQVILDKSQKRENKVII
jgi:hypothetical protein